jgi:glycosyltransferase involved in cell wall biosynthesis
MIQNLKVALLTTDARETFPEAGMGKPNFGTAPSALLEGFSMLPEIEVHVLSCTQRAMVSPKKIAANIWFHSLHVPNIGWLKTGYQGCIRAVRRKLKEIQPDIVHGQGTERDCALAAVFSGIPNVLTIHGNMRLVAAVNKAAPFSFQWLAARLEAFTLPRTDGVVCITNYTREAVGPLAARTWVVPNAVDKTFFEIRCNVAVEPVILCVGAICLRKNQNAFIRALDPLAGVKPFKLLFVGGLGKGDPYAEEFLSIVAKRPWCRHLGFADRLAVQNLMSSAAALALPSLEDNCPMVVLEAAAAGLPVIAANVGGVPDLIEHNVTGLLFDPAQDESIRSAVVRILEKPADAAAMAAFAGQRALARFHPEVVARRHVEIYRDVLSSPS